MANSGVFGLRTDFIRHGLVQHGVIRYYLEEWVGPGDSLGGDNKLIHLGRDWLQRSLELGWSGHAGPKKLGSARVGGRVWLSLLLVQYETRLCLVACMHQFFLCLTHGSLHPE